MLNLCNLISFKNPHLLITVVVTEEWRGFLSAAAAASNFTTNTKLASILNVIPLELIRGSDFPTFYNAVMTEMETPCRRTPRSDPRSTNHCPWTEFTS
ncbi:UDP-glycosyltransferase 87A1 [Linum perenne]